MQRLHEDPAPAVWLSAHLPADATVAIDGLTFSVGAFDRMRAVLPSKMSLVALPTSSENLVDQIWAEDKAFPRPGPPASPVFAHPLVHAGKSVADKLSVVRNAMAGRQVTHHIVSGLDEVAWLLNLRGSDVEYNPLFWSYALVTPDSATLYTNSGRFTDNVASDLSGVGVKVAPYAGLVADLAYNMPAESSVWLDPAVCNYSLFEAVSSNDNVTSVVKAVGPIPLAKARKNNVELDGTRSAHLRDAVAMCEFLHWLETEVVANGNEPSECEAAEKLDSLRAAQDKFVSLSFPTISSSGSNGAIIHYRPMPDTCANVTTRDLYLLDSGGQYRDGTTDVTRTMHFGTPTDWQKECFTRVLRGHIAVDSAVFPKGTTGFILDAYARQPLWEIGLDYKHGTGHGVGSFSNVHEGPHSISFNLAAQNTPLEPGFLTSNEPGYYQTESEGKPGFGIRIETVCAVVDAKTSENAPDKERPFFTLEHLTFVPMQSKMMKTSLMSAVERKWVDDYHVECYEKVAPMLADNPAVLEWLKTNTQPLV
jgi:Xaa-Pro aminopeptidase